MIFEWADGSQRKRPFGAWYRKPFKGLEGKPVRYIFEAEDSKRLAKMSAAQVEQYLEHLTLLTKPQTEP